MKTRIFVSVLMLFLVMLSAGQAGAGTAVVVPPASITVTPGTASVPAGNSVQFKAVGYDADAKPVTVKAFVWSVDPATAGTISKTGMFTAKGALVECTVRAAVTTVSGTVSNTVSDTSDVTIIPGPISTLTITPSTVAIYVAASTPLAVTAKDKFGNAIDTSAAVWSVKPGSGLSVNQAGSLTAGSTVGSIIKGVSVALAGKTAAATVNVSPVPPTAIVITSPESGNVACGGKVQFAVEARDEYGNKLAGHSFTWKTPSGCGTLSSTKGETVTLTAGKKPATGTISVSCGLPNSPTAQMALTVVPGAPKTVTVTGPKSALPKNQTFQFTAKVTDSFGNVLADAPVSWQLTNEVAGSIDPDTGVFTAGAVPNTYKGAIVATVDDTQISGLGSVTVAPPIDFYIRANQPGEYYTYDIAGSGSVSGYKFKISGDATMSFESAWHYDYCNNPVSALKLDLDLTLSAGGETLDASAAARQYYTQDENGALRLHGASVSIEGQSGTAWISDSPGYEVYLPSPMRVGMNGKWSANMSNGEDLIGSYSVKSLEKVSVPAGDFLALKTMISPGFLGGKISQSSWFVPELLGQAIVKVSGSVKMALEGESLSMSLSYVLTDEDNFNPFAVRSEKETSESSESSPLMRAVLKCALDMLH